MPPEGLPVYLIHWRAVEWCVAAAEAVLASTEVVSEVFVVDNECSGGAALREALPTAVQVLPQTENLGYAGGANVAIGHWLHDLPAAELAVVASHDMRPEPRALRLMVDVARGDPRIGVVGPGLVSPSSSGGVFEPTTWSPTRRHEQPFRDDLPAVVDRDYVSGTCMMLRRACAEEVGRFDESFGSYTEDVDYGLRARDAGWRVVVATSARATGRGSVDATQSTWLVPVNSLRLARKREGLSGLLRGSVPHVVDLGRSAVGAVAPWRSRERREASRRAAYKRVGLLRAAARFVGGHERELPTITIPDSDGATVRGRG